MALVRQGRGAAAFDLVAQARRERPDDPRVALVGEAILSGDVPRFHRIMLHDQARNRAYARAIELAAPGRRVLDIGTGSGLDVTIETVAEWAKTLQEKGILLVPVSAAYKGRAS